jgi:hypothetical protein
MTDLRPWSTLSEVAPILQTGHTTKGRPCRLVRIAGDRRKARGDGNATRRRAFVREPLGNGSNRPLPVFSIWTMNERARSEHASQRLAVSLFLKRNCFGLAVRISASALLKNNNLARNLNNQDDKFFNLRMHGGRHRLRPQSTSEKPAMADIEHYLNWPTGSEARDRKPAQSLPNTLPHFATAAADTSLFGIDDITRLPMDETARLACADYLTSRTIVPA